MLCEIERDGDDAITGVGPARVPWPRCVSRCCYSSVILQIRVRYLTAFATLCASLEDAADPGVFHTKMTSVKALHGFDTFGEPTRDCTETTEYNSGPSAIVSGSVDPVDCEGEAPEVTSSPEDCMDTLYDYPTSYVEEDPLEITYAGDSATKDDVRSAALAAMAAGAWSDWEDLAVIELPSGSAETGYVSEYLAEATCGDDGGGGGSFTAHAGQYESELRVLGAWPISIAVSEGEDITEAPVNRYVLVPGSPRGFSVPAPSFSPGWVTQRAVLRCACPVQFAPS